MILCDMDGVLARGGTGDTVPGGSIYRTFQEVPEELERIRAAGIPVHLVTAKEEAEASQVLHAVGVSQYIESIVSANQMFWPTVRRAITRGRVPRNLAKSTARRLLRGPPDGVVVMLEDRGEHLWAMLADGAIHFGILLPPIVVSGGRIVEWYDLDLALRVARRLVQEDLDMRELAGIGADVRILRDGALHSVHLETHPGPLVGERYLVQMPTLSGAEIDGSGPTLDSLDTGRVLEAGRGTVVSWVRSALRILRRKPRTRPHG